MCTLKLFFFLRMHMVIVHFLSSKAGIKQLFSLTNEKLKKLSNLIWSSSLYHCYSSWIPGKIHWDPLNVNL